MILVVKIKICGLTRPCDIEAVNEAQPDYAGFVFAQSRRHVTREQAFQLRSKLCSEIVPVGIFVDEKIEKIVEIAKSGTIDMIQLHGNEDERYIEEIKSLTGKKIIKSVSILNKGDAQQQIATLADYLLFDNKGGGTGESFDWDLIGTVNRPFFLAGGLTIGTIRTAIEKTRPFAIDISSGVETKGQKDYDKIQAIVSKVRESK
ncbi:phosphoribosylanthranilate isomerase [Lachnospiraceae bacterium ZAX-1]